MLYELTGLGHIMKNNPGASTNQNVSDVVWLGHDRTTLVKKPVSVKTFVQVKWKVFWRAGMTHHWEGLWLKLDAEPLILCLQAILANNKKGSFFRINRSNRIHESLLLLWRSMTSKAETLNTNFLLLGLVLLGNLLSGLKFVLNIDLDQNIPRYQVIPFGV